MEFENIDILTKKLRKRLIEYRYSHIDKVMSSHVNAAEIVVCLVEFALEPSPRYIREDEENWFRAGYHLHYVFPSGNEWSDISELYSKLVVEVARLNYFRDKSK